MSVRKTSKLGVLRGERYSLIPEEVMESASYHAQTDWSRVVLSALACRYNGCNNGNLSLPVADARRLAVSAPWKLYAGLRVLERSDLIICTRRGHLERGTKLCSLYALTWRGIDDCEGVLFDGGIKPCPVPSNAWTKWTKPNDWSAVVRQIARANHGREKNPVSTTLGNGRSTTVGTMGPKTHQPRWGMELPFSDHTVVDTSKNSPRGQPTDVDVARVIIGHDHIPDCEVASTLAIDVERVVHIRGRLADGWRP